MNATKIFKSIIAVMLLAAPMHAETTAELCEQLAPWTGENGQVETALRNRSFNVRRPGAPPKECLEHEQALLGALAASKDVEVRDFLVRELELVGSTACIQPMAELLVDERLCFSATRTLLTINEERPIEAVGRALSEAYLGATGTRRLTLVQAMGRLRDFSKAVVAALHKDAGAGDHKLRHGALLALARSGTPDAVAALALAVDNAEGRERTTMLSWNLLLAENLHLNGHSKEAAALCRKVLALAVGKDAHLANRSLTLLSEIDGAAAVDDLIAALDRDDDVLQDTLAALLAEVPGNKVAGLLRKRLEHDDPKVRASALHMLATRLREKASGDILDGLGDPDTAVREQAIRVALMAATNDVVDALITVIYSGSPADCSASAEALSVAEHSGVSLRLAEAFGNAKSPEQQIAVIDVLARRRASDQIGTLLGAVSSDDKAVRKAAIKALPALVRAKDVARLMTLMFAAKTNADRKGLQSAIVAAAQQIGEDVEQTAPFVSALTQKTGNDAEALLQILGRLGGPSALSAVGSAASHNDAEVQIAAVRVLSTWSGPEAAPVLLTVAEAGASPAHRVLALRGMVRQFAEARSADAPCPLSPALCIRLGGMLPQVTDGELVKQLRSELLSNLPNLALKRPVHSSVPTEGSDEPSLAVDGRLETYWGGGGTPATLQVDLGKVMDIDKVHTTFFSDGKRVYQYAIEVSKDGKNWTMIADKRTVEGPSSDKGEIDRFPPVKCRYVRLVVVRNTANGSIRVRELRVFSEAAMSAPLLPANSQ